MSTYTAYLVRDENGRRYLNRPVYTGRAQNIWGRIGESQVFWTRERAQSCASNINAREPGAAHATVVPVQIYRQNG